MIGYVVHSAASALGQTHKVPQTIVPYITYAHVFFFKGCIKVRALAIGLQVMVRELYYVGYSIEMGV